jgi:hypothetical protein
MNIELETGKICTFKLNSGEEMIARVTDHSSNSNWITIQDPVSIAPGPQGMGLVPSMFTADMDHPVQLNINSVALVAETDDTVSAKYIEATTGIRVPDKRIVMG